MDWIAQHLKASYLFNKMPSNDGNSLLYLTVFFAAVIIIGILWSMALNKKSQKIPAYKTLKEKIFNNFLSIGITGLVFVFFRWQTIPYFSAPILMILLLLVSLVIFVYIIVFWRRSIRPSAKAIDIEEKYQKYLPHKKQSK